MAALSAAGPITLLGNLVRLEPLRVEHVPGLTAVGMDDEIWRNMPYGEMKGEQDIDRWVRGVLALAAAGSDIPFGVIHAPSGTIAGATRYMPAGRLLDRDAPLPPAVNGMEAVRDGHGLHHLVRDAVLRT